MSENILSFISKIAQDDNLKKELVEIKDVFTGDDGSVNKVEEIFKHVAPIASKYGHDFSLDDLAKHDADNGGNGIANMISSIVPGLLGGGDSDNGGGGIAGMLSGILGGGADPAPAAAPAAEEVAAAPAPAAPADTPTE